jgi:hypothetical protein
MRTRTHVGAETADYLQPDAKEADTSRTRFRLDDPGAGPPATLKLSVFGGVPSVASPISTARSELDSTAFPPFCSATRRHNGEPF